MVVDRVGNRQTRGLGERGIELLHARIEATDNALQFGELFHQFRREIGLSQARSFVDHAWANGYAILLQDLAQPTAQALDTLGLVVVAAEIFLESDMLQGIETFQQRFLLVRFPEEARIVEARAQHSFIAVPDQTLADRCQCSALPENAAAACPQHLRCAKYFW